MANATTVVETSPEVSLEKKERTISVKFLDAIREKEDRTVRDFIDDILAYEVNNPSNSFGESLTKYGHSKKPAMKDSSNLAYQVMESIFNNPAGKVKGTLVRVQNSRKAKTPGIYSVRIRQEAGTEVILQISIVDISNTTISLNDFQIASIDMSTEFPQARVDAYLATLEKKDTVVSEKPIADMSLAGTTPGPDDDDSDLLEDDEDFDDDDEDDQEEE